MNWTLVFSALGTASFPVTAIIAFALRRKIKAEASKTGADAAAVITGSALELLKEARDEARGLRAELKEARVEIDALREHMDVIQGLLRDAAPSVPIPAYRPRIAR
jgi:hypothetical protein